MNRPPRQHLRAVIPMGMAAAFLLCGYELFRSSSNSLFKAAYGADALPAVTALMPFGLLAMIYFYARFLSWLGPRRALLVTTLFSGLLALACIAGIESGSRAATGAMWILKEAYVILIIAQYWSFLNSTLRIGNARSWNGPVIGISSLGAIAGGLLTSTLAVRLGAHTLLLLGTISFVPAALCSDIAYRLCGEPVPTTGEEKGKRGQLGLHLFRSVPVLAVVLGLVLLSQIVSATANFRYEGLLQDAIPDVNRQTAFSGRFFTGLNAVGLFLQFLIAPLLMRRIPAFWILGGVAAVNVITAGILSASPSLWTAGLCFFAFKAFDYSLFGAAKETLYIPLSFDARYRAKEMIDTFGYRFAKGGTSVVVVLLQRAGLAMSTFYSWIALAAAGLWLGIAFFNSKLLSHESNETAQAVADRT
ncbi:MAG: Npt1/Npt2 family nucleotide transporter [Pseudomonadota bacterium]